MSFTRTLLASALLSITCLTGASAHEYNAGTLHIEHPWARATPPRAGVAGAYMVIDNDGAAPDRLIGASTPAAREVQVHTMSMDNGVMRMRQLPDGLELPAGGTVRLEPGGYHLMLIDPVKPLVKGGRVPLTLKFEKTGSVDIELSVDAMGAKGPAASSHGNDMDGNDMDGHAMKSEETGTTDKNATKDATAQ